MEFGAAFGAFVALGWWVGRHFDMNPWATLVGAGLGFVGSMYNLVRAGLKMQREAASQGPDDQAEHRNGSD